MPCRNVLRLGLILATTVAGCATGAPREEVSSTGLRWTQVGDVALAGQPSAAQFSEIAAAGYRTVLTVRYPEETAWNEQAVANGHGMRFARVPVKAELVEVGILARIRSIIAASPKPVFLHCSSGNRVALVWGMLEAGHRPDAEIIEIAEGAGLRPASRARLEEYLSVRASGAGRLD